MELAPIANYLELNNLGVQGTDLFINTMPAECKQGALLRSPLNGTPINWEIPGYVKTEFSVIVRSHKYELGQTLMASITQALTLFDHQLGGMFVKFIRPHHYPVSFRVSEGNFVETFVKFDAVYCL